MDSAISEGHIVRPWIGARTNAVDATMAAALGLDRSKGAVINDIYPKGPANKAGLEKGDVILSIEGTEVNDDNGLRFVLATLRPNERTPVSVWRDGRSETLRVRTELPKELPARDERALDGRHPLSGATIVNLSPALGEELGFDPYMTGVVLTSVKRRSAASANGFRPGDIILSVGETDVGSTRKLQTTLTPDVLPDNDDWDIKIDRRGRIGVIPTRYLPKAE